MQWSPAHYGLIIGSITTLLSLSALIVRWESVRQFYRRYRQPTTPRWADEDLLRRLMACCSNTHETRHVYRQILAFVADHLGADAGCALVPEGSAYVMYESFGVGHGSFQVGDTSAFILWLHEHGGPVTRHALVNQPALAEMKTMGLQYCVQFHAEIIMPCLRGRELMAVLNFGPRTTSERYTSDDVALLRMLADHCALLLDHARMKGRLADQAVDLREASELKAHLLGNLSHELRTPLSSIIGLSEHLMEEGLGLSPESTKEYLGMIHSSGKRLLHTVTALLDLAKLETNRAQLDMRRISLHRMLEQIEKQLKVPQHIKLRAAVTAATPSVYGDPAWIRNVMEQLLGNAIKYTRIGRIWIETERCGDMLKIGVHDTGIGIAEDRQEEIFGDFVQADGGASRSHEGTGIGLAIARRVIELHGGRIWLQSEVGKGSHVFFTLPLKPVM